MYLIFSTLLNIKSLKVRFSAFSSRLSFEIINNNLYIQIYFLFFVFAYAVVFLAISFGVYSIL